MDIKVKLEALDGKVITPRTGKTSVVATTNSTPTEGNLQVFIYLNENCDSPGVRMATDCVEKIGKEYKFFDDAKRPFKVTVLD